MNLKKVSVVILLIGLIAIVSASAQIISDNAYFIVPLTLSNAGDVNTKILYFGGHRNATYCIDPNLFEPPLPNETELPPVPPSGVFDVRFVDSRTVGKCMGEGMELDFREWSTTAAIKDTHRINLQPGDPGYPIKLSWPSGLNQFYSSISLRAGSDNIDMLTETSYEITDDAITSVRIFATKVINSVKIENEIPESFNLFQNYPNPFNPSTRIKFSIPLQSNVELTIFDVLGRKVNTLVSENMKPGVYSVEWSGVNNNGSPVSSGIYYCRMNAVDEKGASYTQTLKLLLMR